VSFRHRFIYLKTRKTAGTSVEMALQPYCQQDPRTPVRERTRTVITDAGIVGSRLIRGRDRTAQDRQFGNHVKAQDVKIALGGEIWHHFPKIHSIRNPFDMALSAFFWRLAVDGISVPPLAETRELFEGFCQSKAFDIYSLGNRDIVHLGTNYCGNYVIRFENLQGSLDEAAQLLGLNRSFLAIPVTKNTRPMRLDNDIESFYTPTSIDLVLKSNRWVFERFGYPTRP
jgi:hypothetical protein